MINFDKYYKLLGDEKIAYSGGALPEQVEYAFNEWDIFKDCNNILDLGSGDGGWAVLLRAKGFDVIEADHNFLTEIEFNKFHCDMHNMICFQDKEFDGVFLNGVFEHSLAPFILLCEINRVLKIGGEVFLNVPDSSNKLMRDLPQHINVMEYFSAMNLFNKTGFKIIKWINFWDKINGQHLLFKLKKVKDIE